MTITLFFPFQKAYLSNKGIVKKPDVLDQYLDFTSPRSKKPVEPNPALHDFSLQVSCESKYPSRTAAYFLSTIHYQMLSEIICTCTVD